MVLTLQQTVILVGSITLVAGPYLFGRAVGAWLGWRGRSREESVGPLRLARILTMIGLPVGGSIVALATAGLVGSLWASMSVPAVYAILVAVTVGLTVVGWGTFRRSLTPFVRDRRAGARTVSDSLRRRRWLVMTVMPAITVLFLSSLLFEHLSTVEAIVGFTVAGVIQQWLTFPYSTPDSSSYCYFDRDPTEAERDRIEACYDRFDRELPRVRVRTDMSVWPAAFVTGSGSLRTLTVSESLLDDVSDETLGVTLAMASEQGRHRFPRRVLTLVYLPALMGFVFGLLLLLSMLGLDTGAARVEWLALAILSVVVIVWAGLWLRSDVFEADAFAAQAFGPEPVREAYRTMGEDLVIYGQWRFDVPVIGALASRAVAEPPLDMRLRRLETSGRTERS